MAQYFQIVPSHPQRRLIARAAQIVRDGGVIAYPTDSCYALGCQIGDKDAMLRLRRMRGFDERHHLTLMCRDLSDVGVYAKVDNAQYRVLRALTPGSYAFILRGTREVPRRLLHPKRKTIGVRVPDHPVAHALLAELGEPLLSTTALLPGDPAPLDGGARIRERLEHDVDLILDAGSCGTEPTTVIDLTGGEPVVLRAGKGSLAMIGAEAAALIK
jgi:tRNA threonylcarbamoyl adenosine modification protein (Sua5/YciO/YrdC/YwlC family)